MISTKQKEKDEPNWIEREEVIDKFVFVLKNNLEMK